MNNQSRRERETEKVLKHDVMVLREVYSNSDWFQQLVVLQQNNHSLSMHDQLHVNYWETDTWTNQLILLTDTVRKRERKQRVATMLSYY